MLQRLFALAAIASIASCMGGGQRSGVMPATSAHRVAPLSASNSTTKLKCFSGGTGSCTLTTDGALLSNGANPGWSGVYIASADNLKGLQLSQVARLTFSYSGCCAGGGSPRFSLPYTTDAGATTVWTYIQGTTCGTSDQNGGTVGIQESPCTIYTSLGGAFADWATFVAANPSAIINGLPFVVADQPGSYTITGVAISKK